MLSELQIENVATIKKVELSFSNGFNVLLGETGAGKSIIFDALDFVMGGKADKNLIRSGESLMRVVAVFQDVSKSAETFLIENDIPYDGDILINRTLNSDGRSSCKINGSVVTASTLKNLNGFLIDSYGQHENQTLFNSKNHLAILDAFAGNEIIHEAAEVEKAYFECKDLFAKLKSFGGNESDRARLIDLLSYQINEIEKADIKDGELESLKEEFKLQANAEKISESISLAISSLNSGEFSSMDQLSSAITEVLSVASFSEELNTFYERLKGIRIDLEDVSEGLEQYLSGVTYNERELAKIDARIDEIKAVIRKYGGTEKDTINFLDKAKQQLETLTMSDKQISELENQILIKKRELKAASEKLTEKRKQVAKEVERKILQNLNQLGMKNAKFEIRFSSLSEISLHGIDEIEFYFSANLGQDMKELKKIASGGELSRFMLAFKVILADRDGVSTLIFDEIDSGISGEVGFMVAKKIAEVSRAYQVICITHLPQVAAAADEFILVRKLETDGNTESKANQIYNEDIVLEIARLAGGATGSDKAMVHAKELISEMNSYKNRLDA